MRARANETIIYRGENYIDTNYGNGVYRWSSAPQWVFNGSEYVPYIFIDNYTNSGFYQVQSGLIGARIFDYYAVFYDPNMTEVRLYDERWEVQRWTGKKPDPKKEWKDIGAQSGSPTFSISQGKTGINITKSFTSWAGIFEIKYIFREGSSLKHECIWISKIGEETTFRVIQKWAGIVARAVKHDEGKELVTSPLIVKNSRFRFLKGDGSLSIFENQGDMYYGFNETDGSYYVLDNENLKPVEIDVHAQGLKADFVFGNWTLPENEKLIIDPATATLTPPSDDTCSIEDWPDTTQGAVTLIILNAENGKDRYLYINFDISSIPNGAIFSSAILNLYKQSGAGTPSGQTYQFRRITEGWVEATLTWNNAPAVTGTNGVNYAGVDGFGKWWNNSVTGIVQDAYDIGNDCGFRIKDSDDNSGVKHGMYIHSKENTKDPELDVVYSLNAAPTITSASIPDRDDGDNCYEMESYYPLIAVVNDGDGADTITDVYIQIKQGGAVRAEVRGTSLDGVPAYSIQTGATIIDIDGGSCSWVENGDEGTLTIPTRFEWDFTDEANLEIFVYVEDENAASAGFTEMQTNYFDVIGRLVIYNLAVDDGRINLGGTATFSGEIFYSDTVGGDNPSSKFPLDDQFTDVAIHDSGHVEKGIDVTIVDGVFSGIAFAIPSAVQSNTYHVYLDLVADYSDADAPDGDTVAVIGDRTKILTITSDVALLEVGEFAELRVTAELEYDHHALGVGDSVEINGEVLTWDAGDSRFEATVTSGIVQTITYDTFTDGSELTFGITAGFMDGKSVAIEWTIYPPGVPTFLFGAGFNASSPYVELHWTHNLTKVTVFEIQNSSDAIAWDYLGDSTTTNYTDYEVFNRTSRYYKVRACNFTDGDWYNSSFGHPDFETVYFIESVNGGEEIILVESDAPWIALAIILSIIAFLLATRIKR